jgi:hypothetical protein
MSPGTSCRLCQRGRLQPRLHSGRHVSEPLADFLVAPEGEYCAGSAVLRQLVGDVVPYDPDWRSSALKQAADKLRAMHNRNP